MTWTTWPRALSHQEHVASGGVTTNGTWHGFCSWVEQEHANGVWAKGRGPQWSPMAAMEGRRRIEYTAYMSAVTLDCDGAGDWDQLTSQLDSVGAAYLLHRSSSHTPSKPKWRLVLPLAALFRVALDVAGNKQDTRGPNRVWHGIYYAARVLIGELAGFADPASGDAEKGFDPATKSTAQAFYLGHRRAEDETLREVIWRDGFALDGAVLLGLADAAEATATTASPAGGGRSLSMAPARGSARGGSEAVRLPSDTPITLRGGSIFRLDSLPTSGMGTSAGHVACPQHGGSVGGSAYIIPGRGGGTGIACVRCHTLFYSSGVEAMTREQIQASADEMASLFADIAVADSAVTDSAVTEPDIKDVNPKRQPLTVQQAVDLRKADAGRVTVAAKVWWPEVKQHLMSYGWVDAPCGFWQVLRGRKRARLHPRDCGKPTCLHCVTQRISVKLAAIELMRLYDIPKPGSGQVARMGEAMSRRPLWILNISKAEWPALKRAVQRAHRSVAFSSTKGSLSIYVDENATLPPTVNGSAAFHRADGKVTVITTSAMAKSKAWAAKARQIPSDKLCSVLLSLMKRTYVPVDERDQRPEIQWHGAKVLVIPKTAKISSPDTLPLDCQTLWAMSNESPWTVEHQRGADPSTVAKRWKEAGVLREAMAPHHTGEGGYVPGYATTVTIDDAKTLDGVLAMANAEGHEDEPHVIVHHNVDCDEDLDNVTSTTVVEGIPEDALVLLPSDKTYVSIYSSQQVAAAHTALGVTSTSLLQPEMHTLLDDATAQHLLANVTPTACVPASLLPEGHPVNTVTTTPPTTSPKKEAAA